MCRSEAVAFAEYSRDHPEFSFVGLNVADTRDEARRFVERYGWGFPSIEDPDRERAGRLGAAYQPVTILLDAEGRVVARHIGAGTAEDWDALADQLPG